MKKIPLILFGIFTGVVSHAATVNWSAAIDTGIIDTSAAALTAGNFVRIGYFGTLTDAQVQSNALTLSGISTLNSDFHEFANTTIGTGFGGNAAGFNKASSPLYSSLSGFVPSSQIYFWALKSTNNSSLANAVSSVTQTAIADVPFASDANWRFPASDAAPAVTFDLTELSNANRQVQAGTYVSGNSASLTGIYGTPNHALQLATVTSVPEPSVLALGGVAGLSLLASRKRRQRK